jgi:hypothetical protein
MGDDAVPGSGQLEPIIRLLKVSITKVGIHLQ